MKKVYILRGVSGSGKSTYVKKLPKYKVVHSTDNFFYKNGKYKFDFKKLGYFHKKNLENFEKSLKEKKTIIVVDNTNLLAKEAKPYIKKAKEHGYRVILVDFKPKGAMWHYKRNRHNVPLKVIKEQIKKYKKEPLSKFKADKIIRII
jgi:predicted kinase